MENDKEIEELNRNIEKELLEIMENPSLKKEEAPSYESQHKKRNGFDWLMLTLLSVIILMNTVMFTFKIFQ